jgi:hypothetical protein
MELSEEYRGGLYNNIGRGVCVVLLQIQICGLRFDDQGQLMIPSLRAKQG